VLAIGGYLAGYVLVNLGPGGYGPQQFDLFRTRYLAAGLVYMFYVAPIVFISWYAAIRLSQAYPEKYLKWHNNEEEKKESKTLILIESYVLIVSLGVSVQFPFNVDKSLAALWKPTLFYAFATVPFLWIAFWGAKKRLLWRSLNKTRDTIISTKESALLQFNDHTKDLASIKDELARLESAEGLSKETKKMSQRIIKMGQEDERLLDEIKTSYSDAFDFHDQTKLLFTARVSTEGMRFFLVAMVIALAAYKLTIFTQLPIVYGGEVPYKVRPIFSLEDSTASATYTNELARASSLGWVNMVNEDSQYVYFAVPAKNSRLKMHILQIPRESILMLEYEK